MNPITEVLKHVHAGNIEPSQVIQPDLMRFVYLHRDTARELLKHQIPPVFAALAEDFDTPVALALEDALKYLEEVEFREHYAKLDMLVMQGKEVSLIDGIRDLLNKPSKHAATQSIPRYDLRSDPEKGRELDLVGISYGIPLLDEYCKPLEYGDAILIAGRFNMGKSGLAAAIAEQAALKGHTTLWLNNESKGSRILARFEHLRGACEGNIVVRDIHSQGLRAVEQLILEEKPTFVVVDMMGHLTHPNWNLNQALKVEAIATGLREIAAKHQCVMIETAQLDETAKELDWPKDNQIKDSKTAIQGAVDIILMLGGDPNKSIRYLSIGKNKEGRYPTGRGTGLIDQGIFRYEGDYNATR